MQLAHLVSRHELMTTELEIVVVGEGETMVRGRGKDNGFREEENGCRDGCRGKRLWLRGGEGPWL